MVAVSAEIEKTRQLDGIVYGAGGVLDLSLYDTLANAQAGTGTGRLANGYALTDAWLRNNTNYNAWIAGTNKALRFYAADGVSTGNQSIVRYKAAPTGERPCGTVTEVKGIVTNGLIAWYDFSDLSTITLSGAEITAIAGKQGYGTAVTQATSANRPTSQSAVQNGLAIGRFDGIDDYLQGTFTVNTSEFSLLFVAKKIQSGSGVRRIIDIHNNANTSTYIFAAETAGSVFIGQRLPFISLIDMPFAGIAALTDFEAVSYRVSGATQEARYDATSYTTPPAAAGFAPDKITIGAAGSISSFLNGDVGEVIIYNRYLTDSERDTMLDYLKSKWAI
jgi:hypothetical protein